MDKKLRDDSLKLHKDKKGKLSVISNIPITSKDVLARIYTPGVAAVSLEIYKNPAEIYDYTIKRNTVAVVTDGSAVLGLGDIGVKASLPVMEGKAALFKEFGDINAFPVLIDTHDTNKIVETVKLISAGFGGINLEDISAPSCFEVERRLSEELDIPVFHDDQHGTAIVVLAALMNAASVVNKKFSELKVVVNGAGAAGLSIANLIKEPELTKVGLAPVKDVIVVDSKGIICSARDEINPFKKKLLQKTNSKNLCGTLEDAIKGADVFIGVSAPHTLKKDMISFMNKDPIVFALANPIPEIDYEDAKNAGAAVVATGRSDYPNQVNNVLVFPGIFKGLLKYRIKTITTLIKLRAAKALADYVKNPTAEMILPDVLDRGVANTIADGIK